jgi:Clp amino terminal domain, pathogenicity island component
MMFERFTADARGIIVQAQADARRFGHGYIGCEHLLLAAASTDEAASIVLRDQGVTPERVEAEILRTFGRGPAADPVGGIDREALAAIGIDLDVVRARIEAVFGPGALAHAAAAGRAARRSRRPAWRKGPVAELMRRRRRRRARRNAALFMGPGQMPVGPGQMPVGPGQMPVDPARRLPMGSPRQFPAPKSPGPPPRGHIPFTPQAKKSLELSLRQAKALHDDYIGVQHLALALLAMDDGTVPMILSALGVPAASLRAAILERYRKAG